MADLEFSQAKKISLLVVTRIKKESKTIGAQGGELTSSVDDDVAIEVPKNAIPDGSQVSMGVKLILFSDNLSIHIKH